MAALMALATAADASAARPRTKSKAIDTQQLTEEAEEALMMYDIDALDEVIERWEDALSSKKNAETPAKLKELQNRAIAMRNMLARVEQITIVDSLSVDTASFFRHYRLSADAGKITGEGMLTTFRPASGREEFFAESDSDGVFRIMHAGILDDGSQEPATLVDLSMPEGTSALFPFLLSDGTTLYFSSNADTDNSLGGYDIYMTRRDDEGGFYEPTNVGMPYNSPGNDYMMAIDDATGLGWWATDRNSEDGMVTIYVFVPNDTRVNYDPENPEIGDLAFITSVAATQPEGFDAKARLAVLDEMAEASEGGGHPSFMLSMGNGQVYDSLDDFKNQQARRAMQQYLADLEKFRAAEAELSALRAKYGEGDTTAEARIRQLEGSADAERRMLMEKRNAVIRMETGR